MPNLKEYWKKRNFSKTPEPFGEVKKDKSNNVVFVVHDHYARRHHHDLRLEMNGVLKSWAIPKLIDPKSYDKRLAIQTEDHAYTYKDFKGIIPEDHFFITGDLSEGSKDSTCFGFVKKNNLIAKVTYH